MFDPNHNAVNKYFLVDGSLEGTWKYLPKDMGIVCWYFENRQQSLDFFSGHGFKTLRLRTMTPTPWKKPRKMPRDG